MGYRHEWKHEINYMDMLVLRKRLSVIAGQDPHSLGGAYDIRSLYFDTADDKALWEKIDGVNFREKFRIRYYNGDTSFIRLEKKSKINGLSLKDSVLITKEETEQLLAGDIGWMPKSPSPLIGELYTKTRNQGLRPRTIVDYTREAFVFPPGHVRITLDYHIRTGLFSTDLFNPQTLTVPAGDSPIILEVKWSEFLPDLIRDALQLSGRRAGAFSKYAACRLYG